MRFVGLVLIAGLAWGCAGGSQEERAGGVQCKTPKLPSVQPRAKKPSRVSVDDAYATLDPLFGRIESDEELASVTRGERAAYAVLALEGQVNNGGFSQFFFNTGEYANEALAGLRLIGAHEFEVLLERAIAQFPGCDVPDNPDSVQAELDELGERELQVLDAVDTRFFELEEQKTVEDYVAEYMSRHSDEFELVRRQTN